MREVQQGHSTTRGTASADSESKSRGSNPHHWCPPPPSAEALTVNTAQGPCCFLSESECHCYQLISLDGTRFNLLFLHITLKVKVLVAHLCLTFFDPMDCSPRLLCLWDFLGKKTGYHSLLQGNFLTQGWNQGLLQAETLPPEPPGTPFLHFYI